MGDKKTFAMDKKLKDLDVGDLAALMTFWHMLRNSDLSASEIAEAYSQLEDDINAGM